MKTKGKSFKWQKLTKEEISNIISFINNSVDFVDVLEKNCNISLSHNQLPTNIFCPFHDDIDEPSARVYANNSGMYCYGCGRNYTSYDVVKIVNGFKFAQVVDYFKSEYNIEINQDSLLDGNYELNRRVSYYINKLRDSDKQLSKKDIDKISFYLKSSFAKDRLSVNLKKTVNSIIYQ